MNASVIVPARDAANTLQRTLDGLAAQRLDGEFEVIVVDDCSADRTGQIAVQAGARVIRTPRASGPGAARNLGAAEASGEVLAFLDADCVPVPGWLAAGLGAFGGADLVQGRVEPDPAAVRGPFDRTLWVTEPHGLFESANLFVTRAVFDRVGGFDDGLLALAGSHFGEDVVFGWRARRCGARSAFCADALAHHAVRDQRALEFVGERRRDGLFPALVREVPELRGELLYGRLFLSPRGATFALALAGALAGAALRSPTVAAAGCAPYALRLARDVHETGGRAAAVRLLGDSVGLAALVRGSVRAHTLVL